MTIRGTTERGYGTTHQKDREYLIYNHTDGTPCDWCGNPMYVDPDANYDRRPLNADHTKASEKANGGRADRLLHDRCNKSKGHSDADHGPGWYDKHRHPDTAPDDLDWPGGGIIDWGPITLIG